MQKLKIHFLNTIWSDAIILESNNHFAFIDTGSSFYYPMINDYLSNLKITKIDFIILTHFHNDHYGNIYNIIKNYQVDKLYLKHYYGLDGTTSSGTESSEQYNTDELNKFNDILNIAKDNNSDIIYIDDLQKEILEINFENIILELYDIENRLYNLYNDINSPFYNQKRFNENFNSIGVFLKVNNYNIFLGGDVTCSNTDITELRELSLKMINKIYRKHNINKIDIYKSCHHGGGGTNTLPLCKLINPSYTIITNTAKWLDTYNTYDNLKEANKDVTILTTDYYKYVFDINENISYKSIKEDSLFITLNKQ